MAFTHSDSIEVKRTKGKGRGVFARRLIPRGELIEKVQWKSKTVERTNPHKNALNPNAAKSAVPSSRMGSQWYWFSQRSSG